MIVYGDGPRHEDPRAKLAALAAALRDLPAQPPRLARHAALIGALIEAGELAQALADAGFAERGLDAPSPAEAAAMALLMAVAKSAWLSWQSGFTRIDSVPEAEVATLAAHPLPESVEPRRAEGFAYYALYPEAYGLAAAALPPSPRVIGLRSIGTPLAAMVAAARGTAAPVTVRPVGHPFRRELALDPGLVAALLAGDDISYAVVDEGPGLSGSSFGAAMNFLQEGGVDLTRIHLLPGHGGAPGPEAGEAARARWDRVARHPASFENLLLDGARAEHRLEEWAAALLGPAEAPMEEISGGAWRARRFPSEADWPPIHPFMERRKFLFPAQGSTWLLKFAGLGRHGEAAAARARHLHAAGFTPQPAGLLHGFLVERWMEEARPLDPGRADRPALLAHLGRYLGFRARSMPAEAGAGAEMLLAMARQNAGEALGEAAAARLDRWKPHLPALDSATRRVWTDNRLHAWEWLVLPNGRLLKADAVDHAAAHDLIGAQDIAWDLAGAASELGLTAPEREALAASVGREAGRAVDPSLLTFLTPCYLAFQLGYHAMAADALGWNPTEAGRARTAAAHYAEALDHALRHG
ncbi:hypothetical protein [Roseomonas indoligenes]|uniref:Uncharacterized protein n=1 Tax=Roseomonas indoligenes TaxID=2820811 RepID=A0A940MV15_9PROT|nr:hypothetical protein [Pararoseomonas indoligenes]MBP0491460.1 hypothetical protein [Pararoseomonas indoligenes]